MENNINLTNEEINEELNSKKAQMLDEMDEEEREAYMACERAMDNYMIIQLRKQYNANVELIPNDDNHIRINGVRMGYAEFRQWLEEQQRAQIEMEDEEEEEDEYGIRAYPDSTLPYMQ